MSSQPVNFGRQRHAAFPRQALPQNLRIVLQVLIKWKARICVHIQTLLTHVEYVDAPSLDGMRWCDEVERTLNAKLIGQWTWFDTGPRAANK